MVVGGSDMTDARDVPGQQWDKEVVRTVGMKITNDANHIAMWVEANQPLDAWKLLELERMIEKVLREVLEATL